MPGMALGSEPSPGSFVMESVLTCRVIPPRDCAPHTLLEDLRLLEEGSCPSGALVFGAPGDLRESDGRGADPGAAASD